MLILAFLSDQIFLTLFASMSSKFPADRVAEAGSILVGFMTGLCFFSLNKIFLSLFYSLHDTKYPTLISLVATVINCIVNYMVIDAFGGFGLACATSFSGVVQTVLSMYCLHRYHQFNFDLKRLALFVVHYSLYVAGILGLFYMAYNYCFGLFQFNTFFTHKIGFWLWAGPLVLAVYGALYLVHKQTKSDLYFLS